jgi:ferredoxin-NADP reductase
MARDHGFHPARITRVVQETSDTRTYVLDLGTPPSYRAGQFITLRACGTLRSYSMSSSPDTDTELMATVKRVPGGLVSNWIHDNLRAGDLVETTLPTGVFCLRQNPAPLIAFCGGSGVTPILSLVKTALATTERDVRVLAADRDADSVIFESALDELAARHRDRFEILHHLDVTHGLVTESRVRGFVGQDDHADFYLCGPAPFMELAERALLVHGVSPGQIFVERFGAVAEAETETESDGGEDKGAASDGAGTVEIVLSGKRHTIAQHPDETLLESARRAGLSPPFSCEAGNCATCIAKVTEGKARMRANNALEDDEVADGWILTCQGVPVTARVTVVYED